MELPHRLGILETLSQAHRHRLTPDATAWQPVLQLSPASRITVIHRTI